MNKAVFASSNDARTSISAIDWSSGLVRGAEVRECGGVGISCGGISVRIVLMAYNGGHRSNRSCMSISNAFSVCSVLPEQ